MKISDNEKVNKFLGDLQSISSDKLELIEAIRKIFFNANSNLTEDIKYGGIVFNLSNTLIGGIYSYKAHISIEFSNGASFPDPSGTLEGKGKKRRHVKIVEKQDLETKNVNVFVAEAVKQQG